MRILICHLSDIHFNPSNNPVMEKVQLIRSAIISNASNINTCFIIVSGDIANRGKEDEYMAASEFVCEFEKMQKPYGPFEKVYFVIAPGNHDCDFGFEDGYTSESVRTSIIDTHLKKKVIDDSMVNISTCVQKKFDSFRQMCAAGNCEVGGNLLHRTETYVIDGKAILFQNFNTAWISQKKEIPATLSFPLKYTTEIESSNYFAVISVFHHPLHWLEPSNRTEFKKFIEESSDIIITGHEHAPDGYTTEKVDTSNQYYAGGVLQDTNDPNNSTFNIIGLDLDANLELFERYTYVKAEDMYKPENSFQEWKAFKRNKYIKNKSFEISDAFRKILSDTDVKLEHPVKDPLLLDDIYTYPDLKVLSMTKRHESPNTIIRGIEVRNFLLDQKRAIITGDSSIGKTAMAKSIFRGFMDEGLIPIFVEGFEFRGNSLDEVLRVIHRKFNEEYAEALLEKFKQLEKSKRAIIVDDLHLSSLNAEGKAKLIANLLEISETVIVFADDTFTIENLISKSSSLVALGFSNCAIGECGHYLRRVIIKKWHSAGREHTISKEELHLKCDKDAEMVTQLIGKNFLPSYPIFVLLILHQMQTTRNLSEDISSYGHLYESLIKSSLIKMAAKNAVIDINSTYLSVLAYYMFNNKLRVLSEENVKEASDFYNKFYSQDINYYKMVGVLCSVKLLKGSISECNFQYPYIYYYFVAKYMADKIEKQEVRDHIINMAQKLYNEDYGNIMIFLCHLSKSPFIIDELIANANELYKGYEPCDFDHHGSFIKSMYNKIPKVHLPTGDPETNKVNMLKSRDEYEYQLAQEESAASEVFNPDSEQESTDYNSGIEDMIKLNKAFKTIQVLGQIIKNFPGSIDGDTKYFVAEECHLLGMRTLKYLLSLIDESVDILIEVMLEDYKSSGIHTIDTDELEEYARVYIFKIVELLSVGMIKRIADSIANENLRETYKMLAKYNKETSFALTLLSIKMDCLHLLPVDEILKLGEKLEEEKNPFSYHILRRLVTSYFYLNECELSKKNELCDKLKIPKKEVNVISAKGSIVRARKKEGDLQN